MESEGCWEVITCQPYKHHVSLGSCQTYFSFPLCTDLTPGCNLRGDIQYVNPTNVRALDFFFLISTRLPWGFCILMSFLFLPLQRMPEPIKTWLCAHAQRYGIHWSSGTDTTQTSLISSPLFISPSSTSAAAWVGAAGALIWDQPPSVIYLTWTEAWWIMNSTPAQSTFLRLVTNMP